MKFGSVFLGFSFLISKILGLLRDNFLASRFGAGSELDIYYAAFRLPDLLFNILSYGALSAAFVPIFSEILSREGKEKAFRFTNEVAQMFSWIILALSVIIFIFAAPIIKLIVPGFDAIAITETVRLARIMLITPIFFTLGSIAGGVQNSFHSFFGLSIAPILYNLGIIGGILIIAPRFGIYGVAIGVVIGSFLNAASQIIGALRLGFRPLILPLRMTPRVREMIRLAIPRIFGMSVTQLSLTINIFIASLLPIGSIATLNFAANIQSVPIGMIGISIAIVSFGKLSELSAKQDREAFTKEIQSNIWKILRLIFPMAVLMYLLRFQIVRLLLTYGKFNIADAAATADALGFFTIGLVFGSVVFLLARGFYALKDTKTPVMIGVIAVAVNIALSILFTQYWKDIWRTPSSGLALANSLADATNAILLIIFLRRDILKKL